MGFPSPAMDYQESCLSLDSYCKTGEPGVFLFRSDCTSFREGIKPGALMIVDYSGTPVDGSLVLCVQEEQFRLMRLRLYPKRCLQELDKLEQIRTLPDNDEEGLEIWGASDITGPLGQGTAAPRYQPPEAANAFADEFMADYNRRFAKLPCHDFDVHLPLENGENLQATFTWREQRKVSKNMTLQYDKKFYLLEENRRFQGNASRFRRFRRRLPLTID